MPLAEQDGPDRGDVDGRGMQELADQLIDVVVVRLVPGVGEVVTRCTPELGGRDPALLIPCPVAELVELGTDSPSGWPDSIVEAAVAAGNVVEVGESAGDIAASSSFGTERLPIFALSLSTYTGRAGSKARKACQRPESKPFCEGCGRPGTVPRTELR